MLRQSVIFLRCNTDIYAEFPTPEYRLVREDLHMYAARSLVAPRRVQNVRNLISKSKKLWIHLLPL